MNSFNKNNISLFVLLLGIALNSTLHAVTINNQSIDSIIKPGEVITLTFPERDNYIVCDIKNNNIDIKSLEFTPLSSPENDLKELFKKYSLSSIGLKSSDILPNKRINRNSHIIGDRINIKSKKNIILTDCLLESPNIVIYGNQMSFQDCFLINPQFLSLSIDSSRSNYQTIQILFQDQTHIPTLFSGSIDFDFRWISFSENRLYLTNVKEISIEFNPCVWDK